MGLVYVTTPNYIACCSRRASAIFMLLGCGVWMTIGILVMRKMISFKYLRASNMNDVGYFDLLFERELPDHGIRGDRRVRHDPDARASLLARRRAGRPPEGRGTAARGTAPHAARGARPGRASHESAFDARRLHEADDRQAQAGKSFSNRRTRRKSCRAPAIAAKARSYAFMFFRFVMPFVVFVGALVYRLRHRQSRMPPSW